MSRIIVLLSLLVITAGLTAESALPFAGEPPWDATYTEMGEALTAKGWDVYGDGETLFAASGPLELTFRWDEGGFLTGVTFVKYWGEDDEAREAFGAWLEVFAEYGDPVEQMEDFARWEAEGYDVALEVDVIFSAGERQSAVLVRYTRNP